MASYSMLCVYSFIIDPNATQVDKVRLSYKRRSSYRYIEIERWWMEMQKQSVVNEGDESEDEGESERENVSQTNGDGHLKLMT